MKNENKFIFKALLVNFFLSLILLLISLILKSYNTKFSLAILIISISTAILTINFSILSIKRKIKTLIAIKILFLSIAIVIISVILIIKILFPLQTNYNNEQISFKAQNSYNVLQNQNHFSKYFLLTDSKKKITITIITEEYESIQIFSDYFFENIIKKLNSQKEYTITDFETKNNSNENHEIQEKTIILNINNSTNNTQNIYTKIILMFNKKSSQVNIITLSSPEQHFNSAEKDLTQIIESIKFYEPKTSYNLNTSDFA